MTDLPALDPRDETFIDEAVRSGRYSSRAELISQGVQLVRQREDRLAAVKAAIERGIEDVRAGRVAISTPLWPGSRRCSTRSRPSNEADSRPSARPSRLRLVPFRRRRAAAPVLARRIARLALDRLDPNPALAVLVGRGPPNRGHEAAGGGARHLEHRLAGGDPDRSDLGLGDVAAAAEQRQEPARVGIVAAADVHPEPERVLEARPAGRRAGESAPAGPESTSSSGAGIRARWARTRAAAISSGGLAAISRRASSRSSSSISAGSSSWASSRSWSPRRISSGVGGLIHSTSIRAPRSTTSTRLRRG